MDDWHRLGLPVWVRFLAVGTPDPLKAAAAWLRSHGSAPRDVLFADSIRWALTESSSDRDPRALAALGVSAEQLALLRGEEPGVFLVLADQMVHEAAAQATGTTVSALTSRIAALQEDWDARAPQGPPPLQEDSHLDTVRMGGLLADELGTLQQGQAEAHLEACARCGERYIAWVELKQDFEQRPVPPPPPKKDYTVPIVLGIAGLTASALSVLAVVLFGSFAVEQEIQEKTWRGQPAEVRLVQDGAVLERTAEPDSVVSVAVDPMHASYAAFVLRRDTTTELLHSGPVTGDHAQLVPVDVIVGPQDEQVVYVVLGSAPITETAALEAAAGDVAEGLSVAMTRLR